ncbi:CPBP family intramembrane glutamic endopeptidase [Wukongibacter baidiensis]|uniref:CPBP family intramembrane glutamic endopeptidase n=1 Tax=Wukongibacter baidiensis TaxID=1723361 RepID=UPI003D7F6700
MLKDNINKLNGKEIFKTLEHSRFLPNVFLTLLIFFALWAGSFMLGRFISKYILRAIVDENLNLLLRRIITCGLQIIIFFIWVRFIEKRKVYTMGFRSSKRAHKFLRGVFIGIMTITIITIILSLLGAIEIEISKNIDMGMNRYMSIVLIVLGWLVQSASEEIAIRGWLIPLLGAKYSVFTAIFITSVVFGILHLFVQSATVLSFVNLILSGIFFALYAINEDGLWGVWGCHFGWNLALGNIYAFNVSGFSSIGFTVFKIKAIGSKILTGGSFGPEGGLLATLILIVGIMICGFKIKKHDSRETIV